MPALILVAWSDVLSLAAAVVPTAVFAILIAYLIAQLYARRLSTRAAQRGNRLLEMQQQIREELGVLDPYSRETNRRLDLLRDRMEAFNVELERARDAGEYDRWSTDKDPAGTLAEAQAELYELEARRETADEMYKQLLRQRAEYEQSLSDFERLRHRLDRILPFINFLSGRQSKSKVSG